MRFCFVKTSRPQPTGHSLHVVRTVRLVLSLPRNAAALSNSAPVGHAATHAPQLVQESDVPNVAPRSTTTRLFAPRLAISSVWVPSISSQARTQRVHRMQRLWSRARYLPDTSTGHAG